MCYFWPLGVYFIGHFLGTEKKQKGQVFNTYCVRVFSTPLFCRLFLPVSIVVFIEWLCVHPGSWGGSFPLGLASRF